MSLPVNNQITLSNCDQEDLQGQNQWTERMVYIPVDSLPEG